MVKVVGGYLAELKSGKGLFMRLVKVIMKIQIVTASRVLSKRVTGVAFCWFWVREDVTVFFFLFLNLMCFYLQLISIIIYIC